MTAVFSGLPYVKSLAGNMDRRSIYMYFRFLLLIIK